MQPFLALTIRGRGTRTVDVNEQFLASHAGISYPQMRRAADLRPGDWVGIQYGAEWPPRGPDLPVPNLQRLRGSEKAIRYPDDMTTELAFLLGAYLSEGHTTRSNWSVILTNSVMDVLERAQEAWRDAFGLNARITRQPGRCTGLVVSSKRLVEYMDQLGCGSRAANKRVPEAIMGATRQHVLAFLQGVALDAYTTHKRAAKWAICLESAEAINQLQDLLTRLGVVNAQIRKWNRDMGKFYFELYAAGAEGQRLCELIPFLEPDKRASADAYLLRSLGPSSSDVIPGIRGPDLYNLIPPGRCGRAGRGTGRQQFRYLCDRRTTHVTRRTIERAREHGAPLPAWLAQLLEVPVAFTELVAVEDWSGI